MRFATVIWLLPVTLKLALHLIFTARRLIPAQYYQAGEECSHPISATGTSPDSGTIFVGNCCDGTCYPGHHPKALMWEACFSPANLGADTV